MPSRETVSSVDVDVEDVIAGLAPWLTSHVTIPSVDLHSVIAAVDPWLDLLARGDPARGRALRNLIEAYAACSPIEEVLAEAGCWQTRLKRACLQARLEGAERPLPPIARMVADKPLPLIAGIVEAAVHLALEGQDVEDVLRRARHATRLSLRLLIKPHATVQQSRFTNAGEEVAAAWREIVGALAPSGELGLTKARERRLAEVCGPLDLTMTVLSAFLRTFGTLKLALVLTHQIESDSTRLTRSQRNAAFVAVIGLAARGPDNVRRDLAPGLLRLAELDDLDARLRRTARAVAWGELNEGVRLRRSLRRALDRAKARAVIAASTKLCLGDGNGNGTGYGAEHSAGSGADYAADDVAASGEGAVPAKGAAPCGASEGERVIPSGAFPTPTPVPAWGMLARYIYVQKKGVRPRRILEVFEKHALGVWVKREDLTKAVGGKNNIENVVGDLRERLGPLGYLVQSSQDAEREGEAPPFKGYRVLRKSM